MNMKVSNIFEDEQYLLRNKEYVVRDSQIDMANIIEDCFKNKKYAILEAGTGTGKSYAYLIPSMLYVNQNIDDIRVVISTATINLQDQIFKKDIPYLKKVLNSNLKINYFSGKNNYLCIREIKKAMINKDIDQLLLKKLIKTINSGKIQLINELSYYIPHSIAKNINCSIETCTKKRCSFYKDCHYFRAKIEAFKSNILIVNHTLLLKDAKVRLEAQEDNLVLPYYNTLVIDEAHTLEKNCQESFKKVISMKNLITYLELVLSLDVTKRSEFFNILSKTINNKELNECIKLSKNIIDKSQILLKIESQQETYICKENAESFKDILDILKDIELNLNYLKDTLVKSLGFIQELPFEEQDNYLSYKMHLLKILNLYNNLYEFFNFEDLNEVKSIISNSDDTIFISLPLKIDEILSSTIYSRCNSVIFTSATLNLGDNFNFYKNALGLYKFKDRVVQKVFDSPFDYKRNLLILSTCNNVEYSN